MVAGAAPPPAFLAVADSVNRAPAAGLSSSTTASVAARSALRPETALLQPASATHMTAATAAQEMGMMIAFEQPCECMIMRLGAQARECQQAHTSNYDTNTPIWIIFADSIRLGRTVPGGAQGAAVCITYVRLIPRVVCTHSLEQKVLKVHQKRPLIGHPSHSVFGNDPAPFTCRAGSCRVKWEEASGGQKAATIGCLGTLLVLFVVVLFTCTGGSSGTSTDPRAKACRAYRAGADSILRSPGRSSVSWWFPIRSSTSSRSRMDRFAPP